jgi:hypothetical protein
LIVLGLSTQALLAGPATKIVILLPGQTLTPGGIVGTPTPQQQREWFEVLVVAVDSSFQRDYDYFGPIAGLSTSEGTPTPGLRFGTTISAIGAATTIPQAAAPELRLSINGESYRDYPIGPATTGEEVCTAIETAIIDGNAGRPLAFDCVFDPSSSRYTILANDERPIRTNARHRSPPASGRVGAAIQRPRRGLGVRRAAPVL